MEYAEHITRQDLKEVMNSVIKLEEKLRVAMVAPELQKLHLLDGLTQESQYKRIVERLHENTLQKSNLANYLLDTVKKDVSRCLEGEELVVFIESGSTFAYFAAELSRWIADSSSISNVRVLTNNFLALTSLGVGCIAVTPGTLEESYLAFLPFWNARRQDQPSARSNAGSQPAKGTEQIRALDSEAFRSLQRSIASASTIYLTASGFGFLVGPHVGSRANAIFKYCLFNNHARRKLRLCIARSKIHYVGGTKLSCEEAVYDRCYTVFNLGESLKYDKRPDLLGDYAVMTEAKRDSSPENPDSLGVPRSAPTELGLQMRRHESLCDGYGLNGLLGTWRNVLNSYGQGDLELLIGLEGEQPIKEQLREAIREANEVLDHASPDYAFRYVECKDSKDDLRVMHLVIE